MPVTPQTVEAFIYGSDHVDAAIKFIDDQLGSTREKHYRHGDPDDYYFEIDVPCILTQHECSELKNAYSSVGWPVVQVRPCPRDEGKMTVRMFFNPRSKYTKW